MDSTGMSMARLPVLGWASWSGRRQAPIPCVLDSGSLAYTSSGRSAILQGLKLLRLQPGDCVLVPTYHTPTMVAPVVHLKCEPVFYPLDADGAPVLAWLRAQDLTRVRVLMVVHFFGFPQPLAEIRQWCDDHAVALLEDCAHAMFGQSDGRVLGSWGDVAILSLSKFLPMPQGGCLLSADQAALPLLKRSGLGVRWLFEAIETAALQNRLYGLNNLVKAASSIRRVFGFRRAGPMQLTTAGDGRPSLDILGGVNEELAQQGLPTLWRWLAELMPRDRIVAGRRRNFNRLTTLLKDCEAVRPLMSKLETECAPYVFPVWVSTPDPGYATLRARGIPVSRWNWPWPGVPAIEGDCGRSWSDHVLQLACHQDLTDADIDRMAQTLLDVYSEGRTNRSSSAAERQVGEAT